MKDHLQQAKYAVHRAVKAADEADAPLPHERAALETHLAIAYALIAIAEHMSKTDTRFAAQERMDWLREH